MKSKKLALIVSVAAMTASVHSAHASSSGPRFAVEAAYDAAQDGKLDKFRAELTGDALRTHGDSTGMALIAQEKKAFRSIKMEKSLTAESAKLRLYEVTVTGKIQGSDVRVSIRRPLVACEIVTVRGREDCTEICSGHGRERDCTRICVPGHDTVVEDCRISQF